MSKQRSKKYNPANARKKQVIGLIIRWHDTSPLMDSEGFMPGIVTHKNPLWRVLAGPLYARNKEWLVEQTEFFWQVTLTAVFAYPNGTTQHETRELFAYTVLADIAEVCNEQFTDAMRHGAAEHYTHTEFEVQCLGDKPQSINDAA